uniref:Uncharacterized protein n=1 Tax=Stomoxys calcitrans TaxID=35570 RepID=A0A1I8QD95_STOCA
MNLAIADFLHETDTTPYTIPTKIYTTKTTRSIEDFNTQPQIKATKSTFVSTNSRPLYTSYAPPPSGAVSYKNIQLPLATDALNIPILLPKNDYTKHPGYETTPVPVDDSDISSSQMLMIEEPPSVVLQPQHNKTIEAAKILASTLLEASGEPGLDSDNGIANFQPNATDVYIVKSQKKAYIIPTHLRKDISKSSTVDSLYSMRDQFEKAYTINQFIFVIKPEKINFLNKLV